MEAARDHAFHREALGIAADAVVVGAFVNPLKLSRRTMALWKEILDRVPRARIAFSPTAPWLRDAYPRILAAAGIDPARAIVLPQGRDEAEGLARYTLVDFVLDPAPFGNVNGTLEPLNLGVPVVTLCGRVHGERTGYSILSNLSVTSTIANTGREYVAIAVRLAEDADFRDGVRREIAARLADSPLFDMRGYARRLEAAYREAMVRAGLDPGQHQ
jgi:predicted O-linked N-acetylglucosamine transferase (SPINDLY family)